VDQLRAKLLENLRSSLDREEQELAQLEVEVLALESKKVTLESKRGLVAKYRDLIARIEGGENTVSLNGMGPDWISPSEFKGKTAQQAALLYLEKHGKYEGKGRVPVELLLARLRAGGAHIGGDTDKSITSQALRAALARLATDGAVRYDREKDWVQLSEWSEGNQ
jgi:hypothetical protein